MLLRRTRLPGEPGGWPGIARFAQKAASGKRSPFLESAADAIEAIEARHVFEGARQGDPACLELVDQTAMSIARGLVSIMMMILPEVIVLTGGVLRSYDLLEERIHTELERVNVIIPARQVKLQLSQTGQQAGILGAARAAQLLLQEAL